jgi:fatty-acyl-CoA synthase
MKVVDLAGNVVAMGQQGEICVRSQLAFRGYLDPQSVGVRIDQHGWLHLDDGGMMTRDGYVILY